MTRDCRGRKKIKDIVTVYRDRQSGKTARPRKIFGQIKNERQRQTNKPNETIYKDEMNTGH